MTPSCTTCVHYEIDTSARRTICDVSGMSPAVERQRTHRTACGLEGRRWETKVVAETSSVATVSRYGLGSSAALTDGDFKRKVGVMPIDTINGLGDLGADAGADAGVWLTPDLPPALAELRTAPLKVALVTASALLAWAALFALGAGCVWVGWMISEWRGV